MQGKIIGIKIDGGWTPCELECQLQFESELLPTSSRKKGYWRDFVEGLRGWSVSLSGRMTPMATNKAAFNQVVQKYLRNENSFEIAFATKNGYWPAMKLSGKTMLVNCDFQANTTEMASYNMTFQGCGNLEFEIDDLWSLINAMPAPADKPKVVDTTHW